MPLNAREPSPRYTIRQQSADGGATSDLSLQETSRRDSATYTCVASNPFGQDNTTINLIVQGGWGVGDGRRTRGGFAGSCYSWESVEVVLECDEMEAIGRLFVLLGFGASETSAEVAITGHCELPNYAYASDKCSGL